jgi:hypothetical protein
MPCVLLEEGPSLDLPDFVLLDRRFANHSKTSNSQARVMMVNGEHRVGLYATSDLKAGTELFYDYGYHNVSDGFCPQWGNEPTAKKASKSTTSCRARSSSDPLEDDLLSTAQPRDAPVQQHILGDVGEDVLQALPKDLLHALIMQHRQSFEQS